MSALDRYDVLILLGLAGAAAGLSCVWRPAGAVLVVSVVLFAVGVLGSRRPPAAPQ